MTKWILIGALFLLSQTGGAQQPSFMNRLIGKCAFAFKGESQDQIAKGDVFLNIFFDGKNYSVYHGHAEVDEAFDVRDSQLNKNFPRIHAERNDDRIYWGDQGQNWVGLYMQNPNHLNHLFVSTGKSDLSSDPYPGCYFFE